MISINSVLLIFILLHCYCFSPIVAEDGGGAGSFEIPQVDKSKWVDPNDFKFRSLPSKSGSNQDDDKFHEGCPETADLQSELSSCRLELNDLKLNPGKLLLGLTPSIEGIANTLGCSCSNDPTLLKHVVHRLLIKLRLDTKLDSLKKSDYFYEANLRFSASDVKTLQRFLDIDAPDMNLIQDARLAMETFLQKVHRIRAPNEEPGFWENFWSNIGFYLQIGNFLLLVPAAAIVLPHLFGVSVRRLALYMFFVVFCLSCVWTWLHLYKEKQAERQARYAKVGVPRECFPEQHSAYKALTSYLSSLVRFPQPDECLQYYKDIMIDPCLEVAPTEAIAITASVMLLRPLGIFGEHLANFINAFYSRLPLTIAPFATILLLIFGLFVLLMLFGYRIRLPLFLGVIEPGQRELVHHPQPPQEQLTAPPVQAVGKALPHVQSLPEQRDRSPSSGPSRDRGRLTLRESNDTDAEQLRHRGSHRSVSLPRVADGQR